MDRCEMSFYLLAASLFLVALTTAPPAVADDAPVAGAACQQPAAAAAGEATASAEAQGEGGISDPGAQADCYARCKNGSYLRCTGPTCWAVDTNCNTNTSGYCYGSYTGYKYCNDTCGPVCGATASCADAGGGSVSCSSYGANDCYAINNCYAYCNGTYHWCPSPKNPCPV